MHFPHPHHVSSFIFQIKLVNTSRKYFINSSMLLNENWLTRSAHMSTTERRKVLAESYWMASRLVQVIANLSLNFQQHHTYLFETPTSLRLLGHHHSRFSSVWSLAASLSTAHHLCHNSVFLKARDIYTFTWHIYNNESCQKQVIISLSSPQALYYKVLLFSHFLLVFYLNWVDSDSKDVADNSIQLKLNTIILLSSL